HGGHLSGQDVQGARRFDPGRLGGGVLPAPPRTPPRPLRQGGAAGAGEAGVRARRERAASARPRHVGGAGDRDPMKIDLLLIPVGARYPEMRAAARRITLGPLVLNTGLRHPGLLANMAATLQQVSGGRLLLGLGAGATRAMSYAVEHESLGIPVAPDRI